MLSEQYLPSQIGNMYMAILVVGNLDKSHLQHLQQIVVPITMRNVTSHREGLQEIVLMRNHVERHAASQNVNSRCESNIFPCTYDC